MDTRARTSGGYAEEHQERPGLGAWMRRNPWLLLRLFIVVVFSFGASTVADQFAYGMKGEPVELSVEQINEGRLPPGVGIGEYVRITGTPDVGENLKPENIGQPESGIGISSRYSVSYFYFQLEETDGKLLVQTAQGLPDFDRGRQVWDGRLSNVGTVIFHDTTQEGLERADLPHDESIPVIETGDTPEYYRDIMPAYSAVIVVWLLSIAWLVWKRNRPFLGL